MQKRSATVFISALVILVFSVQLGLAEQDEYDESQSHPLRIIAYFLHPVGRLLEWTFTRPLHAVASSSPELEYLSGHRPHITTEERLRLETAASQGWVVEKVTIKEVPVEKIVEKEVIREVPKVVEVEKVVFSDVAFRFDSARLTELGQGKVYLAAQKLQAKSDILIVIEGHADYIGSEAYNMALAKRRAEAVKRELVRLGIDPGRMSVESYGQSRPLLDQKANWARAVNRRVEFRVAGQ
ncbi:MAG: OmpA family protein [Nitrospinae bacterium]|nr:OmpA family protein [Nitrospinota bacterium]